MFNSLRSLIRETLLLEEVYGAQATVYHGTKTDPQILISAILRDEFRPGKGDGSMYGKGLYTVYDPEGTRTMSGKYGDWVIKFKVNLYGYIIFDPDIALKVYKKPLSVFEQAQMLGYSENVLNELEFVNIENEEFTSQSALRVYRNLQYDVKGLVFTGRNDGRVVVIYDPTTAVPMAWKQVAMWGEPAEEPWTQVDRKSLLEPLLRHDVKDKMGRSVQQSALRRSAMGDFEKEKYRSLAILKKLEKLPEDQRIVRGDFDLAYTKVTSLPSGLKVSGTLYLNEVRIESLPTGLQVGENLVLSKTQIKSLSADIKIGGNLYLTNTPIASLPKGLKVGSHLILYGTNIISLPEDLDVGGNIEVRGTSIRSLPESLKVGGFIIGNERIMSHIPDHLKGKIR